MSKKLLSGALYGTMVGCIVWIAAIVGCWLIAPEWAKAAGWGYLNFKAISLLAGPLCLLPIGAGAGVGYKALRR